MVYSNNQGWVECPLKCVHQEDGLIKFAFLHLLLKVVHRSGLNVQCNH